MTTLLAIKAHPHIKNSLSLAVGDQFIASYRSSHPDDQIIIRDLYEKPGVPPLNDVTMEAWRKQKFGEKLSPEEKGLLKRHEEWLDEFISADKYVFINPMYNHFLPAEMKQYLDLTAVARKTFKYTPEGPVGLLKNKKAIHIQAAGSVYHKEGMEKSAIMDVGDAYLTAVLKFYGITDIEKIFIEGADAHRDRRQEILEKALDQAKVMAKDF